MHRQTGSCNASLILGGGVCQRNIPLPVSLNNVVFRPWWRACRLAASGRGLWLHNTRQHLWIVPPTDREAANKSCGWVRRSDDAELMLFCISFICPVCQQRRLALRLHTAVFTCKIQMNVIMHPLPFFSPSRAFCSGFNILSVLFFNCCPSFVSL